MLENWAPVLIFFILVAGFGCVSLVMSYVFGVKKPNPRKLSPYECGMQPVGTARERFSVKFYLVAMLFLLFDIEACVKRKLGVNLGETTPDGLFSAMEFECLGSCTTAPVMQINGEFYENLDVNKTEAILDELMSGANASPTGRSQ